MNQYIKDRSKALGILQAILGKKKRPLELNYLLLKLLLMRKKNHEEKRSGFLSLT